MQYSFDQIVGGRSEQQDKIIVKQGDDLQLLVVVADGMGGEKAGALASHVATESFLKVFECDISTNTIEHWLKEGLQQANDAIAAIVEDDSSLDGMGTTLIASYVENNRLYWISVGDSLLLLYRDQKLKRLNADHSFQAVLDARVERGDLSAEDAAQDPRRCQLLSALCGRIVPFVDSRFDPFLLQPGDMIITASDGILSMSMEDLSDVLHDAAACTAEQIVRKIINAIIDLNSLEQDNTSIAVQLY